MYGNYSPRTGTTSSWFTMWMFLLLAWLGFTYLYIWATLVPGHPDGRACSVLRFPHTPIHIVSRTPREARTARTPRPTRTTWPHAGTARAPSASHAHACEDRLHHAGGAPAVAAGGYGKWVPLQHVQHQIYLCNIQMKNLQHMSETLAKQLKTLEKPLQTYAVSWSRHVIYLDT
jgi:hypothetical protein